MDKGFLGVLCVGYIIKTKPLSHWGERRFTRFHPDCHLAMDLLELVTGLTVCLTGDRMPVGVHARGGYSPLGYRRRFSAGDLHFLSGLGRLLVPVVAFLDLDWRNYTTKILEVKLCGKRIDKLDSFDAGGVEVLAEDIWHLVQACHGPNLSIGVMELVLAHPVRIL